MSVIPCLILSALLFTIGTVGVIVEQFEGQKLNSLNDLTVNRKPLGHIFAKGLTRSRGLSAARDVRRSFKSSTL